LAALGLANVGIDVAKNGYPNPGQCTLKNVAVRREWYVLTLFAPKVHSVNRCIFRSMLTKPERRNYIDAIKCLHSKPALTPAAVASGARSRFDDFVVTHVLQTYSVHATVGLKFGTAGKVKLLILLYRRPQQYPRLIDVLTLTGQLLILAPLLHLRLRATSSQRMWLQRLSTILQLGMVARGPCLISPLRRQRH
jgi:hypothetical protein